MTINDNETKKLIHKIKSLLAKTVEQGASEHEAIMAMNKAHELLEKYQLNLSDLDIREEGTEHITINKFDQIKLDLAVQVAKYCECKVWKIPREKEIHFLGIKTDAQFAEWLLLALADFVSKQEAIFMFSNDCGTKLQVDSFTQGCVKRINERLREEIAKRTIKNQFATTGRDLIPLKNAMITEAFKQLGIHLGAGRAQRQGYVDPNAYNRGKEAGNNVGFNRPINRESNERKLLA